MGDRGCEVDYSSMRRYVFSYLEKGDFNASLGYIERFRFKIEYYHLTNDFKESLMASINHLDMAVRLQAERRFERAEYYFKKEQQAYKALIKLSNK